MRIATLFFLAALLLGSAPDTATVSRLRGEFQTPPTEYTQVPFWFWNGEITEAGISEQIASMEERGVHGFLIHARMGLSKKIGYMTPEWLDLVRFAVEEAERRGMIVYLYDEGMYPSGSAHGKVVEGRPDLASQGLEMRAISGDGPAALDATVVARSETHEFRLVPSGGVIRGVHFDEEDNQPGAPKSADLLNVEAAERFIDFTHERYREAVGEHFGRTIRGIFTDEPSILGRRSREGLVPWTEGLLPRINEFAGYDVTPYLHLLWEDDAAGLHEVVRSDYRRAVAAVLNDTYYRPLSEWCARHGLALTGHPEGGGDMPPQVYFQQPGQDVVWRWVLPGETAITGAQSLTGKTASSMALHLGRDTVINECYGAYGWRLTMSEMKWLADWLFVRGTNLLMPHAFYYSVEGPRLFERPPDLAWASLWWDHYRQFADYTSRLSWLMRGSEPVADVAILALGGEANWRAARVLLESQIDFFYVDEVMLDTATIRDGRLVIGDAEYRAVILDEADHLTPETHRRLRRLIEGRVPLIAYESHLTSHPLLPDTRRPSERWTLPARAEDAPALLEAIREVIPSDVESSEAEPDLRYAHRIKDGVHFYLVTNEGERDLQTDLTIAQGAMPEVWDAETGESRMPRNATVSEGAVKIRVALPARGSTIFAFSGREWRGALPDLPETSLPLSAAGWRLTAGDRTFEDVQLGSWTSLEGMESYSGTMWYEREIEVPEMEGAWTLDLGEVREIAEVELNGKSLGARLWPPYRFDVTGFVEGGQNTIRIGVTNTRANELTKEKLPSGLFGEVRFER